MAAIAAVGVVLADSTRLIGLQGALTLAFLGIAVVTLLNVLVPARAELSDLYEPRSASRRMPSIWLTLFMVWVGASMLLHPVAVEGYQNLAVYLLFFAAIPSAAAATTAGTPIRVLKAFRTSGVMLAVAYLGLIAVNGPGSEVFYSARAAGGSLLFALAAVIPLTAVTRGPKWVSILIFVALAGSLSRGATGVALILLMTFAVRGARAQAAAKSVALGGLILAGVVFAYQRVDSFRARFEVGDGYTIGGFTLGSSGRASLWEALIQHWKLSPWTGHGLGSSEAYVLSVFRTIKLPHNDYLKLLHDFGIIGLTLWVAAFIALLGGAVRRYQKARTDADEAIHLAAILLLVALGLFMIANNPIVSVFAMLATGAVLGVSIARDPSTVVGARAGMTESSQPVSRT